MAPVPRIHRILLPLSWLYGLGVKLRNALFSYGILKEETFSLPVICIGNLSVGGTGKTPHVEYLLRLLKDYRIAVLSRGYGRKTRGYIHADANSTSWEIGDEPYQITRKFPHVTVAVDEKRVEGIQNLREKVHPDVILLDDAYQHRYVKAGLNILLTDYNRLMTRDALLPAGRLREPLSGKDRAQCIIITKCPGYDFQTTNPEECALLRDELKLNAEQHLFFSSIRYGNPEPVFQAPEKNWQDLFDTPLLLLVGIANPQPLLKEISKQAKVIKVMEFRDHHQFTDRDIKQVSRALDEMGNDSLLLTTEKDASRLKAMDLPHSLQERIYQIPIHVEIKSDKNENFDYYIINIIESHAKN